MQRINPLYLQLLSCLTWKTRVATFEQLAAGFEIPVSEQPAFGRGLLRLVQRGWLREAHQVVAPIVVDAPLFAWAPGNSPPDVQALAWQLARRWREAPGQRTRVVWATDQAVDLVGGVGGKLRQPLQLQHDLGTAAVYFHRQATPEPELRWISEDAFRAFYATPRQKQIPDALLLDEDDDVRRVIEFGGQYGPDRLARFHRHWCRRQLAYELW